MGLDIVELVMETEEAFGIAIPDDVAAQLVTPARLVEYVAAHVALKPGERCESQHVFHRLRRGFRSHVKALRWQVRRDTPLQDLVRKKRWPEVWEAIRVEDLVSASWHRRSQAGL
jgi:hypothetical protein